jgi:hypothetical protein
LNHFYRPSFLNVAFIWLLHTDNLTLPHINRCFRAAYSDHCASKHPSLDSRLIDGKKQASSISAVKEGGLASVENELTDANSSDMKGQQLGMPIISDDDDWVANCVEKEYIPVLEDVGCILKVFLLCRSIFDEDKMFISIAMS